MEEFEGFKGLLMFEAIWFIRCLISNNFGSRDGDEFLGAVLYLGLVWMREDDIFYF
jgi:hypothetical protein